MATDLKRKRLLVTDLHEDYFRFIEVDGECKLVPAPIYQIIGNGENPNSTAREVKNGAICVASNGSSVTRTWFHDGTQWIGT